MKPFLTIFSLVAVVGSYLVAAEKRIELPPEKPAYPPGPGADVFAAYCLACHSTEYITTQPKMPRKFWEATVLKMRDKFGAPLPEESVKTITDYLTEHFGS
ncbi:SorB family sulfite dehydrogenase c-type cytochrome subunit [Luteolibacter soli]|uniref:Cytochrome c n=1 Tax=Luteolibacter soli TaxID=3135280 RepID=A0ABU9B3J4_9BACT